MISKMVSRLCDGDISQIENYERALRDEHCVWRVFHRNLNTGVGQISIVTLKYLGRFYGVKPHELVFMTKAMLKDNAVLNPPTTRNTWDCSLVFKWWLMLNPYKMLSQIDESEFNSILFSVKRLRLIFAQMKARCYNPKQCDYRWYGAKGVKICDKWLEDSDEFVKWSLLCGYRYNNFCRKGEQLSIDRIDSSKDYSPENCRWISHSENSSRARTRFSNCSKRQKLMKFANMFPKAVSKCGRIDWSIAMVEYFSNSFDEMKKFLVSEDYTPMGIWRIRKRVEKRSSQQKIGNDNFSKTGDK